MLTTTTSTGPHPRNHPHSLHNQVQAPTISGTDCTEKWFLVFKFCGPGLFFHDFKPHAPTRDPSLASENSHLRPYTLTLNPELICCERCVTVTLLWDLGVQFCVIRRRFHSCALRNRKLKGILSVFVLPGLGFALI